MKKFLVIPDLHGRNYWKKFGDIGMLLKAEEGAAGFGVFEPEFDKYIFLGDYCDSFFKTNDVIKDNLLDIINFKEMYPDHVELLWGNHEMHYLYNDHQCSGFRPLAWFDLNEIFRKKRLLFNIAYQYKNYLFTHSGVHKGWFEYKFKPFDDQKTLAESLNWAFEQNIHEIFDIGWARGGQEKVGGPLWLDKSLGFKKPLKGYHQFVGHSPVKKIQKFNINKNTSITFCDCQKDYLGNVEDNFLILEI